MPRLSRSKSNSVTDPFARRVSTFAGSHAMARTGARGESDGRLARDAKRRLLCVVHGRRLRPRRGSSNIPDAMKERAFSRAACISTCLSLLGLLAAQQKACPWLWDAKFEQSGGAPPIEDGKGTSAPAPPSIGLAIQDAFAARGALSAEPASFAVEKFALKRAVSAGEFNPHAPTTPSFADLRIVSPDRYLRRIAAFAPLTPDLHAAATADPSVGLTCRPNAPPA